MQSCPVSGMAGAQCPAGSMSSQGRSSSRLGPRGCSFSGYSQPGDIHAAFDILRGVDAEEWLRMRERKSINDLLYKNIPSAREIRAVKNIDTLTASEHDVLAVALGAPARQVMLRAEEIGPATGWKDGYLSAEHGFCPPDYNEAAGALANSPGRIWSDLCERMPGCFARGRGRESIAALPLIEAIAEIIPDKALWAAHVTLGLLCHAYRYEEKYDGNQGVTVNPTKFKPNCEIGDDLGDEFIGIPRCIALPFLQVSHRIGRPIPHLTFFDQTSFNMKLKDPNSTYPYIGRFDNMETRWPIFGERTEMAFQKGCADTSASFQHGPDAIASCQEHVMNRNSEGLLRELVRLKEILERMPNAFHTINTNPNSGENYVPGHQWVRYARFSASLSKRCPASSGLQSPPYLVMDAFLGRKKAFIAAIEYHYRIPEFVQQSGDPMLMGVLDGIVFGLLEVAGKTGRSETNGLSGAPDSNARPWEETHKQFSEAMKERLEPYRGNIFVEPHEMRGTFEECGDRLAVMPLNSWEECAKVAAALGLGDYLETRVALSQKWERFSQHLGAVTHSSPPELTVKDILRRGHIAPITKELALKVHDLLRASSNTALQVLATEEWPVRGTLGDLLQSAVADTNPTIWDRAFDLTGDLSWLADLIAVEVPRTYSISTYSGDLLPSTVDLTISRAEYKLCSTFAGDEEITCAGVGSGFLNPFVSSSGEFIEAEEEILIGVSRPLNFQLPIDRAAPCAYFAAGRDLLYLGVQSRDKFCYEDELRDYIDAGLMEVHLAFSRDTRGLVYDKRTHDLVEKDMPPRYIDALIVEQAATISELVMSKKQGGLGGYLYVCGSVAVFDSVMNGIRKALYNHCTATMETVEVIINKAFAERRFMLDVFMTPKPLPCNLPTIPLSQLARQTGHRPGGRIWIGVHGSAYDVTDFCPMHPGGTLILKSNAGGDCSKSFDNLAHTNNPEVNSLLTKYFVGQLTPKPEFHGCQELGDLYDLWAAYLRTAVETLVDHQFQMHEIMGVDDDGTNDNFFRGAINIWSREHLVNVGLGVRTFYEYQSRLLQGGFSALFGPKLQELVLKLSFILADSAAVGAEARLPDVLGTIARAKTSPDAVATSHEVTFIGQFVGDNNGARFAERGIMNYAAKSVELDIELLEDIHEETCLGMDAFGSIMAMDGATDDQRVTVLSSFLMQTLERMAKRLEIFYAKLAQHKVYQPEIERNPARTRWNLVRRKIQDASFFILTQEAVLGAAPAFIPAQRQNAGVNFDAVMSRVQASDRNASQPKSHPQSLNAMHMARASAPPTETTAMATHDNSVAIRAMSTFIDKNRRAIRRLSKMPSMPMTFEQLQATVEQREQEQQQQAAMMQAGGRPPTPPSSGGSTRLMSGRGLNRRSSTASVTSSSPFPVLPSGGHNVHSHDTRYPVRAPPTPPPPAPVDAATAMNVMMGKLNVRSRGTSMPPAPLSSRSAQSSGGMNGMLSRTMSMSNKLSTNSLRAFRLGTGTTGAGANGMGERGRMSTRIAPSF
ncbi:hypothetical protein QBC32DRAFT_401772 [Pseudoneurospora amorphoporcata]|uniref:NADPH--hemoprotein reductase n=1 Tax=Pseudoneurospora amorphoporcata TaxID=241081 RepID=A0AAN6SBJ7_9PEZI|nr:hypothetical protein QBC32DRAFT_401772 [Pseudoneurospora amorphoporcata]